MGLITLLSAAAIKLSVLWDPEVWGQIPTCARWRGKPFTPPGSALITVDILKAIRAHTRLRPLRHRRLKRHLSESLGLPRRGTEERCPQLCFPLSDTTMSFSLCVRKLISTCLLYAGVHEICDFFAPPTHSLDLLCLTMPNFLFYILMYFLFSLFSQELM